MERVVARYRGKLIPTGSTQHVVAGAAVEKFDELQVIQLGERAYSLIYLLGSRELTDTFHESATAAFDQAEFEFGVRSDQWEVVGKN